MPKHAQLVKVQPYHCHVSRHKLLGPAPQVKVLRMAQIWHFGGAIFKGKFAAYGDCQLLCLLSLSVSKWGRKGVEEDRYCPLLKDGTEMCPFLAAPQIVEKRRIALISFVGYMLQLPFVMGFFFKRLHFCDFSGIKLQEI